MKCIILAAGYATRLSPLTDNFPKPLLEVQGKSILDHLVDNIERSGEVDGYVVVSNHRYAGHFSSWAEGRRERITVLDDGTSTNDTRLGAVRDIKFAIDTLLLDDDLLVIAGDNLIDFPLGEFLKYARRKGTSCVMRYSEPDGERLHRCAVACVDADDMITSLEEKPARPKSNWICPPFYFYTRQDASLVDRALADGCGTDAPGSYLAWLSAHRPVHAMLMPGRRYDIGDLESYLSVQRDFKGMKVLVTGAAGFIGANLVMRLLADEPLADIVGVDNMNGYYDVSLKEYRLNRIAEVAAGRSDCAWRFIRGDISDAAFIDDLFAREGFDVVVNLAAQAGVRYSTVNPGAYIESNITGFYNILEACRRHPVKHLVYASSSSVYGGNTKVPFSEEDPVDSPVSLYAATKKSNELMAHAYGKLYDIPSTGLRFFTVYGPAGRPDMAYFSFTEKLLSGGAVDLFNYGECRRDFTYVDDIVEGVVRVIRRPPGRRRGEDGLPLAPCRVFNIGGSHPERLMDFVTVLEEEMVRTGLLSADYDFEAHHNLVAMQPGDVPETFADTSALEREFGFRPSTPLRDGLRAFVEWYANYYKSR